jgi:uroporphyrinogen decarboxylase
MRLLRALTRQPVDRTPVWMMRQAGRYLPEYRAVRKRAGSFMALCRTPELACEVTLQPLRRFPLDAAILFSDILTIPEAMNLGLSFIPGEGPRFSHPLRDGGAIDRLRPPDIAKDLGYVMDTVRMVRRELNEQAPLIGFAGSPWTLATYMVEGASSRNFPHIKAMLLDAPDSAHLLLRLLAESVRDYLNAQIEAGAQAVQIFDTWGGVLTQAQYKEFSLDYMGRIVDGLVRERDGRRVPVILFTKGGGPWLEAMAETGADALSLDWTCDLGEARRRVGERVALQGNLDPSTLYATPEAIREQVAAVLDSFGPHSGHVFNLGHGMLPDMDPERAGAMVNAVRELSPAYAHGKPPAR